MFKETFKYYKSKSNPPNLDNVLDFDQPINESIAVPIKLNVNLDDQSTFTGCKPVNEWQVYKLVKNPGLIFIRNPFTNHGQRYWISRCLQDYPKAPHSVNLVNIKSIKPEAISDWWTSVNNCTIDTVERNRLKISMRWATLGYHHDWDTKIYTEKHRNIFPNDLAELCRHLADNLEFHNYAAQAAIVNFYPIGTTLAGHTDHSEKNLEAPLFSFSFGQTAIFLIGGQTIDVQPTSMFLKSGDIVIMSKESRLCYHAVPKVMKNPNLELVCPWMIDEKETVDNVNDNYDSSQEKRRRIDQTNLNLDINKELCVENWNSVLNSTYWHNFNEYLNDSRININVRQVLHAGDLTL